VLVAEGLLSDQRFSEGFIHSRRERGQGPLRIEAELRQRGVDAECIAGLLDVRDAGWRALAAETRRRRFGDPIPREFSERARQARFLRARGFTEDQVRSALRDDGLS
jgi:regulatory protein